MSLDIQSLSDTMEKIDLPTALSSTADWFFFFGALANEGGRMDLAAEMVERSRYLSQLPSETLRSTGPDKPNGVHRESAQQAFRKGFDLLQGNHYEAAESCLRQSLLDQSSHPEALLALAVVYEKRKRFTEAEACLQLALPLLPWNAGLRSDLGMICLQRGNAEQAEMYVRQAILLEPPDAETKFRLGKVLVVLGKTEEALTALRESIRLRPESGECQLQLGMTLRECQQIQEAEACLRQAVRLLPERAEAFNALGNLLEECGKSREALDMYEKARLLDPHSSQILSNIGVVLSALDRPEEAEREYRAALHLCPDSSIVHNNLGNTLRQMGRHDESEESLRRALELDPDYAEAHNNLGIVLSQKGLRSEAAAEYEQAIRLRPDYPEAHLNRAMCWLGRGDFERGWKEYEWRFEGKASSPRHSHILAWEGRSFAGKTLLIHTEQGNGDSIQFVRFIREAKNRGGTIVLECPESLVALLQRVPGVDQVIAKGKSLPHCNYQTPLLSLPYRLQVRDPEKFGRAPYLTADPERSLYWKEQVARIHGFRVGIVWQGNPKHRGDRTRSMRLEMFAPLAAVPGVQLISLQREAGREQLAGVSFQLSDLGERLQNDWSDTASLLMQLDLVIAVDTGIIHLAGGLGVPAWVALPFAADWRWLQDREDSPWYGSLRLFRQSKTSSWKEVIERIETALREEAARKGSKDSSPTQRDADNLFRIGSTLFKDNKLQQALEHFEKALVLQPANVTFLNSKGAALAKLKRLVDAECTFRDALRHDAQSLPVLGNLALCCTEQGKFHDAENIYRDMIRLSPQRVELHLKLAALLKSNQKKKDAIESYREAIRLKPEQVDAWNNLGILLEDIGRPKEAEEAYREALKIQPRAHEIFSNLGVALAAQDRIDAAEEAYREAIRIQPKSAPSHNNLGNALRLVGRLDEAEASLRQAIHLKGDYAEAHNNLGVVLLQGSRVEEARQEYSEAIRIKPDYAEAHLNLALALLVSGEFDPGWKEYDWRWKGKQLKNRFPQIPLWQGEPIEDKSILLHAEQGLGDALQFVRYAPLVRARCGRVIVECHEPLTEIFRTCDGIDAVFPRGSKIPAVDFQCPFLNVPKIFGTRLENIPAQIPYLRPHTDRVEHWTRELVDIEGLRVGITWQGNPQHKGDRFRSVKLEQFATLARIPGVSLISLQKYHGREQLKNVSFKLEDFGEVLQANLIDPAALLSNIDLLISVDSALVHLAGALGVPVWVPLPFAPDWRWMRGIDHSPWYPSLRHFRQLIRGDWDDVFARIEQSLRDYRATRPLPILAKDLRAEDHHQVGSSLYRRGKFEAALPHFQSAAAMAPQRNDFQNSLGANYAKLRRLSDAEDCFRRVLEQKPDSLATLGNLALCCQEQGKLEEAERIYRTMMNRSPNSPEFKLKLAQLLRRQKKTVDAAAIFEQVSQLQPKNVDVLNTLGILYEEQGKYEDSARQYRRALELDPQSAEVHSNLGVVLANMDRLEESEFAYRKAIELKPRSAAAFNNLGNLLRRRGNIEQAENTLREAIAIEENYPEAYNNLGIVLNNRGKHEEAIACYKTAIRLRPTYPEAYNNLAILYADQHCHVEALDCYDNAIRLKPNYAEAHLNRALCYLVMGDFERGWPEYEHRWRPPLWKGDAFQERRWTGESLEGKSLLLRSEQGLGDTLQFARVASWIEDRYRPHSLFVECPEAVADLLTTCPGVDQVIIKGKPLPPFDYQIPLLSVPAIFGITATSSLGPIPYFSPPEDQLSFWREELRNLPGLRVGIAWQGNPGYKGDRNRSIKLERLAPLAKVEGIHLISLQKGPGQEQIEPMAAKLQVLDFSKHLRTFMDTAALVNHLDLIISVDTAVAHLAGAMNKLVWVLLPFGNDWRWMRGRDDSPWYPTLRLMRQPAPRNWDAVIERVTAELRSFASK